MKIGRKMLGGLEWRMRAKYWKQALHRFKRNKLTMVALLIILSMTFIAIFADYIAPYPEDAEKATHFGRQFLPPSAEHPFGTDEAGRDVLSRTIFAARISLSAALGVQAIVLIVGVTLGTMAGYVGGWTNAVIMRSADTLLSLPSLALALVVASTLEKGFTTVVVSMIITQWPWYARLVQSKALSIKEETFVEASRSMGKSSTRVVLEDILPSLVSILTVKSTLDMGYVILLISGMSFLGLGVQAPTADWGMMISTGRVYLPHYWWLSTFPGLFIFLSVLGFSLAGDGLRDLFDVRLSY